MTLRLREHSGALADLREAAIWYEEEGPGLGDDFIAAIDDALQRILQFPTLAPLYAESDNGPQIRSTQVAVFPYRVIYCVSDSTVFILAYTHHRRSPTYWQDRLDS
ncbi:type II toxin-antitoxin system RelE/ParE family toxin [Brevibacterium luteolum]|uniref:type II toxin-antitoxin system RelE/ParE family toxin n=1 Tax=Brevibacterium luteolum TaxID=199591 RepID=UPI00223BB8A1|nr:type II toxin-antitoxin system RelE/ParE family toxin [Brevibacterium luteolum]MCT1920703.1 type II toxin-antitoxin system RelE/ParE family toxin [Brevibacterium luteolum]